MRSCRHLFSSVVVLGILGAACTGNGSDGSAGSRGGAGGSEASAAGGSSTDSSNAQGGSVSNTTSVSTAGSGGIAGPGGTTGTGGSGSRTDSSSGGTASSGGTSRSSGTAGTGGTSSRATSNSTNPPTKCHDLGAGGMTELPRTYPYGQSSGGGPGGTGGSGQVGGTTGSKSGETGGTVSGSGGATGTGDTACTPEQLAVRNTHSPVVLAWDELPDEVKTFMTSVLPLSYIQDHLRFYSQNPVTPASTSAWVSLQIEYGCETVRGYIDWYGTCTNGQMRIRNWNGPSQASEIKIDRAEAIRRMTDAGCDPSNLTLSLLSGTSRIPGALDCDGQSSYPAVSLVWLAGLQDGVCPAGMPSPRCRCYKTQCQVDVETGAIKVTPGSYACPACH